MPQPPWQRTPKATTVADRQITSDEVVELFRSAASGGPAEDSYRLIAADPTARLTGPVWFGVDSQGRNTALRETPSPAKIQPYWISRVIEVCPRRVRVPDGDEVDAVRLRCDDPGLSQVFATFIGDVLHREARLGGLLQALSTAAADWRELLAKASAGLSDSEALGLYGELRFLEALVDGIGPRALELWAGDRMDRHDFSGAQGAAEIKTTTRQSASAVTVHGLTQLLPPEGGFLALAVAEVDQGRSGESLDDVRHRLVRSGCDESDLTRILMGRGWNLSEQPAEHAASQRFTIRSWRTWRIDRASPVLSLATLPDAVSDAVSDVSYRLSLASLGEHSDGFAPEAIEIPA